MQPPTLSLLPTSPQAPRSTPPPHFVCWIRGKIQIQTRVHERACVGSHPWRCQRSTHLDLTLSHPQRIGQACSLWSCQVLRLFESLLQGEDLLTRECRSGVFSLPILVQQNGSLVCEGQQEEGRNNSLQCSAGGGRGERTSKTVL